MCRNYDAGECEEPDCTGRITCNDFNDNRCFEHSINGRGVGLDDEVAEISEDDFQRLAERVRICWADARDLLSEKERDSEDYAFLLANVRDAVGEEDK